MSKAVTLFLIVILAVSMVELKPLSEADVECNSQPGGCAPKEEKVNPRPKRHLYCLLYPQLCVPQYYIIVVQPGHKYNIINGNGNNNSVVIKG